eukprot:CAMPEP_0115433396 /NCGR_PEP_ID=MMETSP0271-20121206/32609_1 /TAXON_ID=71861 /ORGANISM="Scrippsiella trochoidea, Strain CCMP3099" /LENGTH=40 /DNA_ID= /DNA_START= /DNA_END= /DNA_ORIENTATION=
MPSLHQNVFRNLVMIPLLEGGEDVVQLGLLTDVVVVDRVA